jgi:hypothetical protein
MLQMAKNKPLNIILVIVILISGFGREYLMVNINWILNHLSVGAPNYAQDFFNPLLNWTVSEINKLKWVLTIVFTTYFFTLTYFLIRSLYPANKKYQKITIFTYFLIVLVSGIVFVFGYVSGTGQELYPTVRTLMGLAQSFIPLMILYLLFKFMPNENGTPKRNSHL